MSKTYNCNICKKDIMFGFDAYTHSYWVKCQNIDCEEFGKVKTYIDINEYKGSYVEG